VAIGDPHGARADTWLASPGEAPGLVVAGLPSGVDRVPAAFRAVLARFTTLDGETGTDLSRLAVTDLGDWEVTGLGATEEVASRARRLAGGPVAAFIGGDGAVARPLIGGLARGDLSEVGLLTLDARHDVLASAREPADRTWLRSLIEDGLPDGRVVQVGTRSFADTAPARAFCAEHGIEVVTMETVEEVGAGWVVTSALRDLRERCAWIFLVADLGVLDAAFAPGCPQAGPGGMTPRHLTAACRAAGAHPGVRAAGFGGVGPLPDPAGPTMLNLATAFLAFASGVASREVPNA